MKILAEVLVVDGPAVSLVDLIGRPDTSITLLPGMRQVPKSRHRLVSPRLSGWLIWKDLNPFGCAARMAV
jgi:hypothetical protein